MATIRRFLTSSCQSGSNAHALATALAISAAPAALAAPTGWAHHAAGFQSNGAVTVKSLAGGAYAGTQNPTGAVAKANQNAATQAPTVIVQATASLPIKAVGDLCVVATSGSSPNQISTEGAAIMSDRSSLLTCQSGAWKRNGNSCWRASNPPGGGSTSQWVYCMGTDPQNGAMCWGRQVSGAINWHGTTSGGTLYFTRWDVPGNTYTASLAGYGFVTC